MGTNKFIVEYQRYGRWRGRPYLWVRRKTFEAPRDISDLSLVRKAKKEIGLTGVRCDRNKFEETIELCPRGTANVLFIYPKPE